MKFEMQEDVLLETVHPDKLQKYKCHSHTVPGNHGEAQIMRRCRLKVEALKICAGNML